MHKNTYAEDFTAKYEYDSLGRLVREEIPFSETETTATKYYYDSNSSQVKKQVQNNLPTAEIKFTKTENAYDSRNRLVQVLEYDGERYI